MRYFILLFSVILFAPAFVESQTIAEKKANLHRGISDLNPELDEELLIVNRERRTLDHDLKALYREADYLHEEGRDAQSFAVLLEEIQAVKDEISLMDERWQSMACNEDREAYALWHQPDTTLEQLVIDYGSKDFVYLIPHEIGSMKMSLCSDLPIPRSAWSEMLEWILQQNGVEVVQVNPYLRKLSLIKEDLSSIKRITNDREELLYLPSRERICFVLTPDVTDVKRAWLFIEKFANPQSQQVHWIGRDILIAATAIEVEEFLKLYDFAMEMGGTKEYQLVPLCKMNANEMARMLAVLFDEYDTKKEGNDKIDELGHANGLKVLVPSDNSRALFLVGTKKEVKRAEEIICRVESQMCDSKEKEVYWYSCKHSDPEEMAQVLEKVYNLMVCNFQCFDEEACRYGTNDCYPQCGDTCNTKPCIDKKDLLPDRLYPQDYYQTGNVVVNPAPVTLGCSTKKDGDPCRQNFIVDAKTGSIVMVVERDLMPRIKETIRKLDVPKKMVQIEVLLFEKRTEDRNDFNLNLLKVGAAATNSRATSLVWNDVVTQGGKGILDFFISRPKDGWFPAYDLMYSFLISQNDMQINSSPSVLTVNQTEAKISIVDEISVNMGIYNVETAKGNTLEKSFTRAQYGINLCITPTIHTRDDHYLFGDDTDYITLQTKVNFDTFQKNSTNPERPDVTRREISNEAIVADGESVILGGLRKKTTQDMIDKIPFLGDIPFVGKFFSNTAITDSSTDMYIMITPKIVRDPLIELEWIKQEEMCRRPGDLPDYLCRLERALRCERERLFESTISMFFGRRTDRCYAPGWQRDGNTY